ncbi:MAG: DNA repair protein RecO [Candidatus Thioglobus sp.]|nr:DNA repair protein RecO [Candidatus Thioglobus sp.]
MSKIELTPAFLIHRRTFKNNSLLLDFFTRDYGKIRLVGRGIRAAKTNIQMFQKLSISFSGRGKLQTLTHWETDDLPRVLSGETLILSIYVNELIERLLPENDVYLALFEAYQRLICQIATLEAESKLWLLRLFENNLLAQIGYGLDFARDVEQMPIEENESYEYLQQSGFRKNISGKISGILLNKMSLNGLENMPDLSQLKICRNLNRQRLEQLLGDKPLQSRSLIFTPINKNEQLK